MFRLLAATILCISIASCNGCGPKDDVSAVTSDTVDATAEQLSTLNTKIQQTTDRKAQYGLMEQAYALARNSDKPEMALSYAISMIKQTTDSNEQRDLLLYVAETMSKTNNTEAAQLMLQGLVDRYNDDPSVQRAKDLITSPILDKDAYIQKIAESVFINPDKFGINTANAQKYVDVCEAHGLAYPNDGRTPEYLYKASEIAVAIRTFAKSLSLYDWLIDFYPTYSKTPNALFAKGYLLDEELKKRDRAKAAFTKFIETYPTHELADDAQFLLENIGKSGEEIIKIIEAKKAKKVQ